MKYLLVPVIVFALFIVIFLLPGEQRQKNSINNLFDNIQKPNTKNSR